MGVRFTAAHGVYHNHMVHTFAAGDELPDGELAEYLRAGGAPIEESEAAPAVDSGSDGVPDGSVAKVLEWVGDDRTRAETALTVERAKGDDARTSLVGPLEKLLGDN